MGGVRACSAEHAGRMVTSKSICNIRASKVYMS